ncbi:MAG: TIGR02147 family protein [Proteobacteria bacterium]|nr:MAG: TIGR02147 family protein [Pseudomonadota bacterium]
MEDLDYRSFIVQAYERRRSADAGYTMRAYAKDLGVSPQLLSQVLGGKLGLSASSASAIAQKIELEGLRKDLFIASVEAKHSRSQPARLAAAEKLRKAFEESGFEAIALDHINLVSSWKHVAVCMLVELDDFTPEPHWISSRLDIEPGEAARIINDLFKAELLKLDTSGKWVRQAQKTFFKLDESSPTLQKFYRDMWLKAEQSLVEEEFGDRSFSAATLAVSESDIEFIRSEIEAFRRSLISKIASRPGVAERIYTIAVQLFPLDRKRKSTT